MNRSLPAAGTAAPAAPAPRMTLVDALRGLAVAQMIAYHFIYDLNYFGWIRVAMIRDAPWIAWRTAIVAQFLTLVGLGLALRAAREAPPAPAIPVSSFWPRWRQIAGAALLVSGGSWFVFRERLIWFGVLHFVACALVLVRPLLVLGAARLLAASGFALALGLLAQWPAFDANALSWIGFAPHKPQTEDFVPLFPWLAAVGAGAALGLRWGQHGFAMAPALAQAGDAAPRALVLLGRWPLTVYLLHQPLLMGLLWLVRAAMA